MIPKDAKVAITYLAIVAFLWKLVFNFLPETGDGLRQSLISASLWVWFVFSVVGGLLARRFSWFGFFGIAAVVTTTVGLLVAFNEAIDPGDSGPFLGTFWESTLVLMSVGSCGVVGFWISRLLGNYLGRKTEDLSNV